MPFPGLLPPGAAVQTPPLANLVIWTRTPIGGAVENDEITTWTDLSGNGNHLTNDAADTILGSITIGPKYLTSITIGGKPVVQFGQPDGQQRALGVALNTSGYTAASVYAVVKNVNENGGDGFWTLNISDFRAHHEWSDGNIYENAFSTARKTVGASAVTSDHLYAVISAANAYDVYRNGTSLFTTATNTFQGWASGLVIGRSDDGSAGGTDYDWPGYWAEFLLYNVAHDTTTRQQVEAYISARYGIF